MRRGEGKGTGGGGERSRGRNGKNWENGGFENRGVSFMSL